MTFIETLQNIFSWIQEKASAIKDYLVAAFTSVRQKLSNIGKAFVDWVTDMFSRKEAPKMKIDSIIDEMSQEERNVNGGYC